MFDALFKAIVDAIVPVGGAIAVLLFAGLVYQTWMLGLERNLREQDRQQAIIEAKSRGEAMTKLAMASEGLSATLGRIETSLLSMAQVISRLDGAISRGRR